MLKKTPMKFLLVVSFIIFGFSANATTYYVSNSGNDNNSGTSTSSPWQTINKVNSFKKFSPGDNILFNRGNTFYGSIIIANSGGAGSPITYGAYGSGAKPIITGFTNVTSWTNLGGNIWESTSAVSTLPTLKMVVINGVNTPMGRYPNANTSYPFLPNFFYFQSHTGTGAGSTSITSTSLGGINWTGADVVVRVNHWTLDKETITSQSGSTINYVGQSSGIADGWGFFIQNDPRTLDVQNEWYYNPSTKKIRIYSLSSPTNVRVTTVDTLIYAYFKPYLTIDNLDLEGANTSAIAAPNSSYSSFTNCNISYTGDFGLDIYGTTQYMNVENNNFTNCGSSAIWGRGNNLNIRNNTISGAGIISVIKPNDYSYGGIALIAPNSLVQYNNIDSSGYCGIQFRGQGVQVRNNFVNHSAMVRDDAGGIYTGFANETGKVIDGNIVLNSIGNSNGVKSGSGTAGNGIYIDDLGNNMSITNNTIANCSNAGLFLHNSMNLTVTNNIIYNNGGSDYTKGGIFIQNSIVK